MTFKEKREFYNLCVEKEPMFFVWWRLGMAWKRCLNDLAIAFKLYGFLDWLEIKLGGKI